MRTLAWYTSSHNNFLDSEVRRSGMSMSIITGMVKADAVQSLLFRMNVLAEEVFRSDTIEISLTFLARLGLNEEEAREALVLLSTRAGYQCIQLTQYQELQSANDGLDTLDVIATAKILPNYEDVMYEFQEYYDYKRKPEFAKAVHRQVKDWSALEHKFESGDTKLDWSIKPVAEIIALSQSVLSPIRLRNAHVIMLGNDVYLQFSDNTKALVKRLRTDQAPANFMRYIMLHPNTLINKAIIQTEVEMCSQKDDMTELVRQCGFGKDLKPYFFSGTTKEKVYFKPESEVSEQIVSHISD